MLRVVRGDDDAWHIDAPRRTQLLGDTDAARTAYLEAMTTPGSELLDRGFLQMKIADLPGPATAASPASAAPATSETSPDPAAPAAATPPGEGA